MWVVRGEEKERYDWEMGKRNVQKRTRTDF
jgi:hypothetical protein